MQKEKSSGWPKSVIIYTDGASRGNPGPASLGIHVITSTDKEVARISEPLGIQTNNFAEYTAVLRALELAKENGAKEIHLRSDSELMIRQMTGIYKVKSPVIKPLFDACKDLLKHFNSVKFEHVRREQNTVADELANHALDFA
jgi:ribonuclease HI